MKKNKKKKKKNQKKKNTLKKIAAAIASISTVLLIIINGPTAIGVVRQVFFPPQISIYENFTSSLDNLNVINPRSLFLENNTGHHFLAAMDETYVKNNYTRDVLINKAEMIVENYTDCKHTEIVLVHGLFNEYLDLYFVNNGNLDSKKIEFFLTATISINNNGTMEEKLIDSDEFLSLFNEENLKIAALKGGEINRLFHLDTSDKLKDLFKNHPEYTGLNFEMREKQSDKEHRIYSIHYNKDLNKFLFGGLGSAAHKEQHNIVELDLINRPTSYSIRGVEKDLPSGKSTGLKTLVVAPKSVTIDYRINYYFENTIIDFGDTVSMNIFVPLYNITSDYPNLEIFDLLAEHGVTNYFYEEKSKVENSIKYDYKTIYSLIEEH